MIFFFESIKQRHLLKPAFLLLRDKSSKCILLIVRGMHSIKDTLTAATGLAVTFHHSFFDEYGATKVVLGYAHHGMVSAAHWIAKCATPYILKAIGRHPSYKVKIVGNSLGAGIAAILTYILRERKEFSSATCIAFAPAACLTWDLAESGQNFITTIINCSDLVPTFSIVSADNLRLQVAASPWLNDLHDQFKQPFTSCAEALSSKCQQAVLGFARCMDCLGILSCQDEGSSPKKKNTNSTETSRYHSETFIEQLDHSSSRNNPPLNGIEEEPSADTRASAEEEVIEKELWVELGKELRRRETSGADGSDEVNSASEIIWSKQPIRADEIHFFPPGRIMHMVAEESDAVATNSGGSRAGGPMVGIYETPRHLYGEIRLSPNMIKDHYMPAYKRMIDLMIENSRRKESS
ncbi:hypothetical protein KSP40_PGU015194 [Platanthera guangdongensis]|uniref:Fungal lipase-type domain-containing protein n=1 Tax=Platanthera guangdongensis TaxID=2320717 RepID=A0ABR2MAE1_9ASPA